ncbi:MAG: T9SS type A sorting domain-containing protein [Nonlabens sp.]|uniref:T9SS type A sorting domain-containing protein n=1 Tax=Nonlabens sp. TaxID=1888209 RepID=UPI003EF5F326
MKKITLLLLLCIPVLSIAQAWEFNNDNGGWSGDFGTLTAGATTSTLTITGAANENPKVLSTTAGVMAPANEFAIITLKNNSNNTYMRVSYPKTSSGRIYKNQTISTNDTSFQTYVIDISNNNHFVGTLDDMQLIFKLDASNNADGSGGTIEIERIEFAASRPLFPRNTYEFDTANDTEGWEGKSGVALTTTGGNLVQDYSNVSTNGNGKMAQEGFYVDASTAQYVHVILQNGTTNDELRFSYPDAMGGKVFRTAATTPNATAFETIDLDVSSADWTGNVSGIELQLRETASSSTVVGGTVLIDRIVFDNNATLSSEEVRAIDFRMFPNPASDVLKFETELNIDNVSIYSLTGAQVFNGVPKGSTINVSDINDGIYVIKVTAANQTMVRKLIIK